MTLTAPPSHREQKRQKRKQNELKTKPKSIAVQKNLKNKHFKSKLEENWKKQAKVFHDCYRPYV